MGKGHIVRTYKVPDRVSQFCQKLKIQKVIPRDFWKPFDPIQHLRGIIFFSISTFGKIGTP